MFCSFFELTTLTALTQGLAKLERDRNHHAALAKADFIV